MSYTELCLYFILDGASTPDSDPVDTDRIREEAKIYRKESNHPLSNYCKQVNKAAGELAITDPSLLTRHGDLLNLARSKVLSMWIQFCQRTVTFQKVFCATESLDTKVNTHTKISADVRQKRISAVTEDIANLDQQLFFKEKRRQQVRNYKLCEDITEEIQETEA